MESKKEPLYCPNFFTQQSSAACVEATLAQYINEFPDFTTLLNHLHQARLFLSTPSIPYTFTDFLRENPCQLLINSSHSTLTLLQQPLVKPRSENHDFSSLATAEIECYIDLLIDVLNNKLAQKPYEQTCDQEDVTEQEHALQAGKLANTLNLSSSDILALLFHDIARPSINDPGFSHIHHCDEGSIILAPLGLSTNYAYYHAFAKYLLYKTCPSYQQLISPTSAHTLAIQVKNLTHQTIGLDTLSPRELASTLFKIMLMRLIDDLSKVPRDKLATTINFSYFDNSRIQVMLKIQLINRLAKIPQDTVDKRKDFKSQIDNAILLLVRAKEYSNNPKLYEAHQEVLERILPSANALKLG